MSDIQIIDLTPGLLLQNGRALYKVVDVAPAKLIATLVYPLVRKTKYSEFKLPDELQKFVKPSNKLLKAYNGAYGFPATPVEEQIAEKIEPPGLKTPTEEQVAWEKLKIKYRVVEIGSEKARAEAAEMREVKKIVEGT